MAITAQDLQKHADDTTDAGFNLFTEDITVPSAGACAITKIYVGADGTATLMDVSNPIFSQLTAGTAEIGKLAAGTASIGTVALSATDNAVLDTIDAVLDTLNAKLVTGTVIGDVNLGATDNAVLDAIAASVAGTLTVGSHAVTNAGTFATQATLQAGTAEIGKLAAGVASIGVLGANSGVDIGDVDILSIGSGDNNIGNVDIVTVPADPFGANADAGSATGSISAKLRFIASTGIPITGTVTVGSHAVTNAGTFATQATLQAGTAEIGKLAAGTASIGVLGANSGTDIGDVDVLSLPASTNTLEVVGDVAHDAAAAGNPVAIAARATNSMEGITQVAAADATFLAADLNGVILTRNGTTLEELVSYSVSNTAGTEIAVTGLDAGGAGIHNYITAVTIHNAHASTNGFVQLLDGSAGTVLWTFPNPAGGGTTMRFDPPLKQPTANTALYWDGSAAITTVYVSIAGYQAQG